MNHVLKLQEYILPIKRTFFFNFGIKQCYVEYLAFNIFEYPMLIFSQNSYLCNVN